MRFLLIAIIVSTGCAATVLETEHVNALRKQQATYEGWLKRSEEERRREAQNNKRTAEAEKREREALTLRVRELEDALADKQRLLDDVSSQLIGLQDAFSKLSAKQRKKIQDRTARERRVGGALASLRSSFSKKLEEEAADKRVAISAEGETLTIIFHDGALFSRGSVRLNKRAIKTVDRLAEGLKESSDVRVAFDVHSDNVRPSGGAFRDTWAVTGQQGLILIRALQKRGVDPSRLSYRSMGQFSPAASNDTTEGRTANRRVVLQLEIPGEHRK